MAAPPLKVLQGVWQWLLARRWRTALAVAVVALAALRGAAPTFLERFAEAAATRALDRRVEVGDVDLAVLPGRVILSRVHAGPPLDGEPSQTALAPGDVRLGASRVSVDLALLPLLRGELRVEELAIDGPRLLRLRDAAGRLPRLFRTASEAARPDEAPPPAPVALDRLRVTKARYFYYDAGDPDRVPLEVGVAELKLHGVSFGGGELSVERLDIVEPSLHVLDDFEAAALEEDAAAADVEIATEPAAAPPLAVRIGELTLKDAKLSILERAGQPRLETAIELRATDVSLAPESRFPLEASLRVESGAVELSGQAGISPPRFDGAVRWRALPLDALAAVAGSALPVRVTSGTSGGELEVALLSSGDTASGLMLAGRASVDGLELSDGAGVELGWRELELAIESLDIDPSGARAATAALGSVSLRGPHLRFARSEPDAPPESAPEPGEAGGPQPRVRIAQLDVSDGALDFEDTSVSPVHRTSLRGLSARGSDLRWPERSAGSLHAEARSPDEGQIVLDAVGRDGETGVELVLSGIGLPAFSPYIADASGYWVDRGRADLEARLRLRGESTSVDSELVLHRLAVTSVAPGLFEKRYAMPLDVALALLRDPRGDIRVPIAFRLEGERSRVETGSIVVASLRQALMGALSSPLKGVGLLLPRGEGERDAGPALAPVAFEPGRVALGGATDIVGLAELLAARPGLGLRLRGGLALEDEAGLAERVLIAQVLADADLPPVDAGILQRRRIEGALEARGRGEAGELDPEDGQALTRWLNSVTVDDDERAAFARARAEALRVALVDAHGVDPERLELGERVDGVVGVAIELVPAVR